MSLSKIEWTDYTFNPWRGCAKVHAGCANCYAEVNYSVKMHGVKWGTESQGGTRVRLSDQGWRDPLAWNRKAAEGECPACNGGRKVETHESGYGYAVCERCNGTRNIGPHRRKVFAASLADVFEDWDGGIVDHKGRQLFIEEKSILGARVCTADDRMTGHPSVRPLTMDDLRRDLFALIDATPHLDWLLLTKRPENVSRMWLPHPDGGANEDEALYRHNVGLGTSVSLQEHADKQIPELLKCRDLCPVLFVSAEPLLEPIEVHQYLHVDSAPECRVCGDIACDHTYLDWIIAGGESGPNARPCNVQWIRSIRDQCSAAGVACFVKQLGSLSTIPLSHFDPEGLGDCVDETMKDPRGGDPDEWPEDLRVREFPVDANAD